MSFTVFLGNLPAWVTADDIRGWLSAESLVADAIKVIRNPETQESKGFAFIEAPNVEEMNSIIRRFDRAPLEDRLLRANPAQPPKPKGSTRPAGGPGFGGGHPGGPPGGYGGRPQYGDRGHSQPSREGHATHAPAANAPSGQAPANHAPAAQVPDQGQSPASGSNQAATPPIEQRPPRRGKRAGGKKPGGSSSAFAEELAKAL